VKIKLMLAFGTAMGLSVFAQASPQATSVETSGSASAYRVVVTSRTVQAVNYRHRSGATDVGLRRNSIVAF
jgi:hypothetical protein